MAKSIATRPDWLRAGSVADIYSVSECESAAFCDYTNLWKHNGYWLFNSPADIAAVARSEDVDLKGHALFYYEVYEQQFDDRTRAWTEFKPLAGLETSVQEPGQKSLQGYDVVSFFAQSSHECSPLSCNSLAESIRVNSHCLLDSLSEAIALLEEGSFVHCEPGPYRIYAVYLCDAL